MNHTSFILSAIAGLTGLAIGNLIWLLIGCYVHNARWQLIVTSLLISSIGVMFWRIAKRRLPKEEARADAWWLLQDILLAAAIPLLMAFLCVMPAVFGVPRPDWDIPVMAKLAMGIFVIGWRALLFHDEAMYLHHKKWA